MDNSNELIEKAKNLPIWIKGIFAFIVAIASFILAFKNNPCLYATVVVASSLIGFLIIFINVVKIKKLSPIIGAVETYKYSARTRLFAGAMIILLLGIAIGLLVYKPSRNCMIIAFSIEPTITPALVASFTPTTTSTLVASSTPIITSTTQLENIFTPEPLVPKTIIPTLSTQEKESIKIVQVIVADIDDYWQVEATLFNPSTHAILVKQVNISTGYIIMYSYPGPDVIYKIAVSTEADIPIRSGENTELKFRIAQGGNDSLTEYIYTASGYFERDPWGELITMSIDTSFLIPENEYSKFYILIPKQQSVVDASVDGIESDINETIEYRIHTYYQGMNEKPRLRILLTIDDGGEDILVEWSEGLQ